MGDTLTLSSTILADQAGVIAADAAGFTSMKSYANLLTSIAAVPLAGGTMTGNLLFSADNTYTIGATGATRPSKVNVGTGGVAAAGDIVAARTDAQSYVYAYNTTGAAYGRFYTTGPNETLVEASVYLILRGGSTGVVEVSKSGVTAKVNIYDTNVSKYLTLCHNATSAIVGSSSGNVSLEPNSGITACVGALTLTTTLTLGSYTVATLPSAASNAGKSAQVTDSNAAASGNYGATVAGSGSNRVKVFSDGTNWVIS